MIDLFFPPKIQTRPADVVHLIDKQPQANKGGRKKLYTHKELLERDRKRRANAREYAKRAGK